MKSHPRLKALAYSVSLAVAQLVASSAYADTAVGVDTGMGNALNPPGRSGVPRPVNPDADVMGAVRHSPSGQLYGVPLQEQTTTKTASGWEYSAGVEAGLLEGNGDKKNAKFREYKDLKNGLYLNYFETEAQNKDTAMYMQAFGGGTGSRDQFYSALFGHYNDWKVRVFFNETQHVFTDTWKSLYTGDGTGNLTIPGKNITAAMANVGAVVCTPALPCFTYGGVTYANAAALLAINGGATATTAGQTLNATSGLAVQGINAQLAATPYSELGLVRKKGGVRFDKNLTNSWKSYVSYTQEKRQGARPFAMNEGNNLSTEIAEPIDYTTHDFLAGLQYSEGLTQANLRASVSLFRNNIGTLNVQDFLLSEIVNNGAVQTATYDLYPDNKAFNLKGEFARDLPDFFKGRFVAGLTWGTNREDDALLPPISPAQNAQIQAAWAPAIALNPVLVPTLTGASAGYAANTALVSNWNTVNALSQPTARQRIDNKGVDLALNLKPVDDLSVKGTFRFFETDNKGGYMAYNPLTGQFGRGFADGNNVGALDTVVGFSGLTVNTAGNCYIPPGYPNTPNIAPMNCTFGLGNTIVPGQNTPVFGQARSTRQTNIGLAADYDLTKFSSLNGSLEREYFRRNFRERDKTWEDKLKLGYVNRDISTAIGDATLRASFETDRKRGGVYNYRTFEDLGTGLPGLNIATILANANKNPVATDPYFKLVVVGLFNRYSYYFRKYDQADRNQNIINTRLNFSPRPDMDFGVNFQLKDAKYPNSFYGLQRDRQNTLNLELNYQPSTEQSFYAFYTYQRAKKLMAMNSGVAPVPAVLPAPCTLANINLYGFAVCSDTLGGLNGARPFTSAWTTDSLDRNNVLGLGFQTDWRTMKFGVDYTYSTSSTRINYGYGATAINGTPGNQATVAALAGIALPNMTYSQNMLMFNLLMPIQKDLSARFLYRYEDMNIKDWHYDGVITGAVSAIEGGTLLLDAGPQNYHANTFGVMFQLKL
ncbi:MAG TPA: MtrB/PioB family outer membrane beta-barrel protein [Gallionella sp.]|nr:MtrB/PioB family outer membrane beta-barrel protein [Gallionella sp.]